MIVPRVHDLYHSNKVNFGSLATDGGIWGVVHKATQGLGFTDPLYKTREALALRAGLLAGAYDFSTDDDVEANVARFVSIVEPSDNIAMVLDFEDSTHNAMSGAEAYEFLDRLAQATGRAPILYGGNRIVEQIDPQDPKWIDMAGWVRLWRARYIRGQPADNAALLKAVGTIPPWTALFMVQYAADGDGPFPHQVPGSEPKADLSVVPFDTKAELAANWAGAPVTKSPTMTAPLKKDE